MITVNEEKCNGCGNCVLACPANVFMQPKKETTAEPSRSEFCISCYHCVSICPKKAITHITCSPDDLEKFHSNKLKPEAVKELFLSRRSIRNFQTKEVPNEILEELLDMATHSETGSNLQSEGFIVMRDKKKLDELESMMADILWNKGFKFMKEKGAIPSLLKLKFGPDLWEIYRRYHEQFEYKRTQGIMKGSFFWNAPALIIVHGLNNNNMAPQNAGIAIRDIEIIGHSMGLGTCWSGFLTAASEMSPKINSFLGLDKTKRILGALMVGYPVFSYKHKLPRKERDIKYM